MRLYGSSLFAHVITCAFLGGLGTLVFAVEAGAQTAPAPAAQKPAAEPAKPAAVTDKVRAAARKAYSDAERSYRSGDYTAAYEGFKKAYDLLPSPHAAYWMAKSLDDQKRVDEAILAYEGFLADPAANRAGDDKVAEAQKRLTELKAKLPGELSLQTVPAGATLTVDGNPQVGETPTTLKLQPGTHRITVNFPGYQSKELTAEIQGGQKLEQRVELEANPKPAPSPPPLPPAVAPEVPPPSLPPPLPPQNQERSKVPAYVTLGIAGGSLVAGSIFGAVALGAKSDFDKTPTTELADKAERNALIADMAFGIALTLGVTGIVLLVTDDEAPPQTAKALPRAPKKQLSLMPYAGKYGGGAAARLSF